jgi:predicted methyltransferase
MRPLLIPVTLACAFLAAAPAVGQTPQQRLDAALAASDRPLEHRVRDEARDVRRILRLAGIEPGMRVLDVGAGGGYLALLASSLTGENGVVYIHNTPGWIAQFPSMEPAAQASRIGRGNVGYIVSTWSDLPGDPAGFDRILMGQVYHDAILEGADKTAMAAGLFRLLRPGGQLIIEDHDALSSDPVGKAVGLHRIALAQAKADMEAAGFRTLTVETIDNPADTRRMNVFHPGIRGRTDRFLAVFERPS